MIAGIVLAAGRGERIGHPKAWLRMSHEGECFFGRACRLLADAGADPIVGVIAPGGEAMATRAASFCQVAPNPDPGRGQLSSLQSGILAVGGTACEAALVLPVDVPLVSLETVRALVDRWRSSSAPVIRPVSADGRHGHPVIFARALFEALLGADPAAGAKPVVRAHASPAGDVRVDHEGAFTDIDTVEDYVKAFGRLPARVELR